MPRQTLDIFIIIMLAYLSQSVSAQDKSLHIWNKSKCSADVRLTPYLAEGKGNTAVIVCPGGSYFWLDVKTEGIEVAKWLNSQGISAFVLEYRVGTIAGFITHNRLIRRGNRYPDPLQDVQRSIQIVREHAEELGIDPNQVGVMGFSAGGHLALMSGIYFDTDVLTQVGVRPKVSLRPDFIAPIYPVVTFSHPSVHKRSRRGLLGEGRSISKELKDSLSLERHVRDDMPPTYIMNCLDDPIVKCKNSELLDSAMTVKNVRHRYVRFKTGGHGFGASSNKTSAEANTWKDDFINWLKGILR